jgi:DNA-binding MurR/RpiR family transcriptional regulator
MKRQETVVLTTEHPHAGASVAERLALHRERLSPREREVGEYLAAQGEDAAFLSAAEIAARIGTSDATVVRTVKALGYRGLQALRDELIGELRARATPAARLERSFEQIGQEPASALEHVLSLQIEFLEEMRRSLADDAFERAVGLLDGAERVVIAGVGPTAALTEYLALRLHRMRRPSATVTMTGLRLADELLGLKSGDVLVLVVYEALDRDSAATLERANELGLRVVLVTDTLGVALADRIDVALSAPRSRAGGLSTVVTTVALFDALILALAGLDRDRALSGLAELNVLRQRTTGRNVRPPREWDDVGLLGDERA